MLTSVPPRHALHEASTSDLERNRVIPDHAAGDDESHITAEMIENWLRHARLRATNLFYLASDPNPSQQQRALNEMTQALREALEEVRVAADELRREEQRRRETLRTGAGSWTIDPGEEGAPSDRLSARPDPEPS